MYAKNMGISCIRTHNDSENVLMLAVNRKMRFVQQAERITFEKEFARK